MIGENLSGIFLLQKFRNSCNANNVMIRDLNWAMDFEMFHISFNELYSSTKNLMCHLFSISFTAATLIKGDINCVSIAFTSCLSCLEVLIFKCSLQGMVKIIFPKSVALGHLHPPKPLLLPDLTPIIISIMK